VEHGGKSCLKLVILPGACIAMNNSPTDDLPLEPVAEWVNTGQLPQAPGSSCWLLIMLIGMDQMIKTFEIPVLIHPNHQQCWMDYPLVN